MANITALAFDNMEGANNMFKNLMSWQEEGLLKVLDAVIITRNIGNDVQVEQKLKKTGKYAAGGSGIGLIAGMILGGPIVGLAVGAGVGAITGKMKKHGIDKDFVRSMEDAIRPETSILLTLTEGGDIEHLQSELKVHRAKVLSTTLPEEEAENLRNLLAREE
jgi:uncharacterized membrane protein